MVSRKSLKKNAKSQLKNNWILAISFVIIFLIISRILDLLSIYIIANESFIISTIGLILNIFLIGLIYLGKCKFFINIVKNSNANLLDIIYAFNTKIVLKLLGILILVIIIVFIGLLFFIIPGVIFSLMYSQVFYIIIENKDMSVINCLKESARLMKGHKKELLILELSFIGWMILSLLTLGIATLYYDPYYNTTLVNFYLEIKKDKELKI